MRRHGKCSYTFPPIGMRNNPHQRVATGRNAPGVGVRGSRWVGRGSRRAPGADTNSSNRLLGGSPRAHPSGVHPETLLRDAPCRRMAPRPRHLTLGNANTGAYLLLMATLVLQRLPRHRTPRVPRPARPAGSFVSRHVRLRVEVDRDVTRWAAGENRAITNMLEVLVEEAWKARLAQHPQPTHSSPRQRRSPGTRR